MKRFLLPLVLVLCYFSCSQKDDSNDIESHDYSLEIIDSLQIDYLGNLRILDYEPESKSYLAKGNRDKEYMILDRDGLTKSTIEFPSDGPYAMYGLINPIGLRDGKIEFHIMNQGFYRYDFNGNRIWQYKLPFDYFYINGLSGDAIYPLGDEIAFIRPECAEVVTDESSTSIFEGIYGQPILQVFDTVSNSSRETMPFPPNSFFSNGAFNYWMFPTVIRTDTEWILYFRNEMKFWVYKEEDGEVNFDQEVALEVNDAVQPIGVPFEQEQDYSELTKNNFPGTIQKIYRSTNGTIVIYNKGIAESLASQYDRDESSGRLELEKLKKNYVAVFDGEFNLLQNNIPVPEGLIFTRILTDDEEILALKHPDFFETEDDFVTYYKLKLLNE
ncbi:hypothetical protein SAMN04489724_4532 [Algoriphagus locisalis]|uniref:6-bladed beta-propeller protein n=1 Tax=Algoriphagus locisalis TaxID=305507 RepID=A0A1I7DXB9_9BACT|nr:hypothetical protein [Algoriphagus locisalis]SFU16275.1 hypothetical protein SAMN04489724_4532 [Algoriphagus locisalis]